MAKKIAKIDIAKLNKSKIQEVMEKRLKATGMTAISKIHPNPYNKNQMGAAYFAALKANIANPEIGFTTPILVRPHPNMQGDFEVVDGEHRYRACKELGMDYIPTINVDKIPDALLKYLMLEQNAVRGQTKDEDQKRILQEIQEDEEWKKLMADFDPWSGVVTEEPEDTSGKYNMTEDDLESTKDATTLISLYLTPDQAELFRKITGQLRLSNGYNLEAAVMECVSGYGDSTGLGEPTGDEELDDKDAAFTNQRIERDKEKARKKAFAKRMQKENESGGEGKYSL